MQTRKAEDPNKKWTQENTADLGRKASPRLQNLNSSVRFRSPPPKPIHTLQAVILVDRLARLSISKHDRGAATC